MIAPQSTPQFRMSQGIVCSSASLTITPYVTDAWSFNRPIEYVTRQNIYDEDTGEVKYVQETPRFEKDNYNFYSFTNLCIFSSKYNSEFRLLSADL